MIICNLNKEIKMSRQSCIRFKLDKVYNIRIENRSESIRRQQFVVLDTTETLSWETLANSYVIYVSTFILCLHFLHFLYFRIMYYYYCFMYCCMYYYFLMYYLNLYFVYVFLYFFLYFIQCILYSICYYYILFSL